VTFGSLFAGIGGFDLGLERAGMTCSWQVEIDPYARRVLEKHWPNVRRWDDVRTFPPNGEWGVDLICGGFPCQDISNAGKRAGINGRRSGLWSEYARIVGVLRPRYVLVENVAALLGRGMGRVLGDLSSLGYDAEWEVIPASAVGAPHVRERVWLLAYSQGGRGVLRQATPERLERSPGAGSADSTIARWNQAESDPNRYRKAVGVALGCGRQGDNGRRSTPKPPIRCSYASNSPRVGLSTLHDGNPPRPQEPYWWAIEPDVGRVAYGVPDRVDRLKCLGNAVVPQVVAWIGRRLRRRKERNHE